MKIFTDIKPKDIILANKLLSKFYNTNSISDNFLIYKNYYLRIDGSRLTYSYMEYLEELKNNFIKFGYGYKIEQINFYDWLKETYGDNYSYIFEGDKLGLL